MTYLNCFSIVLIGIYVFVGVSKGWLSQAYYLIIGSAIYFLLKRIDNGEFHFLILPNLNIETQKIVHFQAACILVFIVFYLLKRLHNNIFKIIDEVPGHKLIGGIFGFINGLFLLLFICFVINLTGFKDEEWWTSSLEFQFSNEVLSITKGLFDNKSSDQ